MSTTISSQLSLFEAPSQTPPLQEAIQSITWSHSRRSTLEQCNRRYYYEYFGANKLTAKSDPQKETLHFLKTRVQNRYLLSGSTLHTAIRLYFKYAKTGNIWETGRLINFAQNIFHESWSYSQTYSGEEIISDKKFPPVLLQEYFYEYPDAAELCATEESRLVKAITSFITGELYAAFRKSGSKPSALIEHKIKLSDFPCKTTGVIDLAYQEDGKVTIVDWKIGNTDGNADDSLQLAVYALWAIDHYKISPDELRVCKVHLSSDDIVDFRTDVRTLTAARVRVIQDAERMVALDKYGQEAAVEAFTRCDYPSVCNNCVYRRVCHA